MKMSAEKDRKHPPIKNNQLSWTVNAKHKKPATTKSADKDLMIGMPNLSIRKPTTNANKDWDTNHMVNDLP